MKKSLMISLLLVFGLITSVFAYQGNMEVEGPNYTEERHEQMTSAFENSNYGSWYDLMIQNEKTPGVLRFVNSDNFETFVEMRDARLDGDLSKADDLKSELGMGQGQMKRGSGSSGSGIGQGNAMKGSSQKRMMNSGNCIYN